jgi:hypothetical protein
VLEKVTPSNAISYIIRSERKFPNKNLKEKEFDYWKVG